MSEPKEITNQPFFTSRNELNESQGYSMMAHKIFQSVNGANADKVTGKKLSKRQNRKGINTMLDPR